MPNTPRMNWPYPNENQESWYEALKSFAEAMDSSGYASREDRNLILSGGGTVSWDATSATLDWDDIIQIFSPNTGFKIQLAAASVTISDGQVLYVSLTRAPTQNLVLTPVVAGQVSSDDQALVIAARLGTQLYWRNGLLLDDGDTATGLGAKQVASATDADAIHDNVAGEISAITPKASPVAADLLIIEDSEAANVKKSVQVSALPGSDLRGPAIVVGSTTNGDTSDVCDYLDTGNGAQLDAAIQAADDLSYNKDVWIRPGLYDLGAGGAPVAGITIPAGVKVRGAGRSSVRVQTKAVGDLTAFYLSVLSELEGVWIDVTRPTGANTGGSGAVVLGPAAECRRVTVDFLDSGSYAPPDDSNLGYLGAFYVSTSGTKCRLVDCEVGVLSAAPVFSLFGIQKMIGFYVGSTVSGLAADLVRCRVNGGDQAFYAAMTTRFNDCEFQNPYEKGFFVDGADAGGSQVTDCWGQMVADQFNEYAVHAKDADRIDVSNNYLISTSGNPSARGVYFENADLGVIQGNRGVWPISPFSVDLDATSDNNVVLGNSIGSVTDNGTGNDVAHNK